MKKRRNWRIAPEEIFSQGPVIPVMVIKEIEYALPLAKALLDGGVKVLEITLRTAAALEAIRKVSREMTGAVVGAGTVTTVEELEAVRDAGAAFAISPGITPALLKAGNDGSIALIPGISTISELMAGLAEGYTHFKFFPAEVAGGVKMLQAIAGPFPHPVFCPTGGITPSNYRDYLALDNVACIGGSWLAPAETVKRQDWHKITDLARQALENTP